MKTRCIVIALMFGALSTSSYAADDTSWYRDKLVVTPSIGLLSSNTDEYVYDDDYKLSELNWRVSNVPVLKLAIDYTLDPRTGIYTKFWTTLQKKTGSMNDYDWQNPAQSHWTDWSYQPNTPLNNAYEFDIGMVMRISENARWKNDFLVGYQMSRYNWSSYGGQYWYDNYTNVGVSPPDEHGIDYSQQLTVLYIGLATQYTYQKWIVNASLKGSLFAQINDYDEHLLRNLYFKGTMKDIWFLSSNVSVMYAVTPRLHVTMDFTYTSFFEGRGDTEILNRNTGHITKNDDTAAASNISRLLTFGVRYAF